MSQIKNIVMVVLAVGVICLLLLRHCNSEKCPEVPKPIDFSKQIKEIRTHYDDSIAALNDKLAYEREVTEIAVKERNEAVYKLNIANETATKLINDLSDAKEKKDTQSYVKTCDSLAYLASRYRGLILDERIATDTIFRSLNRQIYTLQQMLGVKDNEIDSIVHTVTQRPVYQPKGRILLGGGIIGNQFALYGFEAGAFLKTKKDKLIGIGTVVPFGEKLQYKFSYYTHLNNRK